MSQESVLSFLKKHRRKWFTVKKISKSVTNICEGSISINLAKLRRNKFVNFRMDSFGVNEYCYKEWEQ